MTECNIGTREERRRLYCETSAEVSAAAYYARYPEARAIFADPKRIGEFEFPKRELKPRVEIANAGKRKAKPAAAAMTEKKSSPSPKAQKNTIPKSFALQRYLKKKQQKKDEEEAASRSGVTSPKKEKNGEAPTVTVDDGSGEPTHDEDETTMSEEGKQMVADNMDESDDNDDDDVDKLTAKDEKLIKEMLNMEEKFKRRELSKEERQEFLSKKRQEMLAEKRVRQAERGGGAKKQKKAKPVNKWLEQIRAKQKEIPKDDKRQKKLKELEKKYMRKRFVAQDSDDDQDGDDAENHHDEDDLDFEEELKDAYMTEQDRLAQVDDVIEKDESAIESQEERLQRRRVADTEASMEELGERVKDAEERAQSHLDGYERETEDEEEEDAPAKKKARAADGSKVVNTDTKKSAINASKNGFIANLVKKRKKESDATAAAAAKKKPVTSRYTVTEEDLEPELYHRRSMPPSVLKEFDETIDNEWERLSKFDAFPFENTEEARKECRIFCNAVFSAAAMDLDAVLNPKDFGPTEEAALAPYKVCRGKYKAAELRQHKKHSAWWTSEALRGARKLAVMSNGGDEDESDKPPSFYKGISRQPAKRKGGGAGGAAQSQPKAVRPIDFAYTMFVQQDVLKSMNKELTRAVYGNYYRALVQHHLYKHRIGRFTVTEADVAAIEKNPRVKQWRCAVSREPIKAGYTVLFVCSAPKPLESDRARLDTLRKAFEHNAFAEDGITDFEQLLKSEHAQPERWLQPVCAFIIESYNNDEDEEASSSSKKRELESEQEQEQDKPAAKKAKKDEASSNKILFDVMPCEVPESMNYTTAPYGDTTRFELKPRAKVRDFMASQNGSVDRVAAGAQVFITPKSLQALRRLDEWLYKEVQFLNMDNTDNTNVSARKMMQILFAPWAYEDLSTAGMINMKLEAMENSSDHDPETGRPRKMFNKHVVTQWARFVLSCFVHPVEMFLSEPKKIAGYARASVLAHTEEKVAIGEVPFGRVLTYDQFFVQFVRFVLDALYRQVLVKAVDAQLEGKEEEANSLLELDDDTLWAALCVEADEEKNADSEEYLKKYVHSDAAEWRGNLKKHERERKKVLEAKYQQVREQVLNEFELDADIEKLKETKVFISRLFKKHF